MKRRCKNAATGGVLLVASVLLFMYPQAVAAGASRGLTLCGTVIIPSLLPFLVVSGTFMRTSLCDTIGRWLSAPIGRLLRLPGVCAVPLLTSFIGGYPTGAVAVARLLDTESISKEQAARMMHICVNAGPAFAVSAVGGILLGDIRVGWMLFAAHVASALLIGVTEALCAPRTRGRYMKQTSALPITSAFTDAVNAAVLAILYMSGFVILFSVVLSVCDGSGLSDLYGNTALLHGFLEVSSGCVVLSGERAPSVFLLGCFLGFGGLSVHCQVRSILSAHTDVLRHFFTFRLLHGLLGGCLAALLYRVIPLPVHTLSAGQAKLDLFTASPSVSVVLLAMCVAFLLYPSEKNIAKRRKV